MGEIPFSLSRDVVRTEESDEESEQTDNEQLCYGVHGEVSNSEIK